jgi:regulator of protease activity HflC (stomatin/prohibitin superfamily)
MRAYEDRSYAPQRPSIPWLGSGFTVLLVALVFVVAVMGAYNQCKIEVGTGEQAVLIRKVGLDLAPDMELSPPQTADGTYYKGVQPRPLTEGRYFYNPYYWAWEIDKQFLVPDGKCGVRIALQGNPLPPGAILAAPGEKGIMHGILEPGARVAFNWYAEQIELYDPVIIPPGSRGVVTNVAGTMPRNPNTILVGPGERGVQKDTLPPGTHYLNPYEQRVSVVDCRSKKFNLGQDSDMDFLSADGFAVTLDGVVEFRVMTDKAAEVFVLYNEDKNGDAIDDEIITKIITPESRSICRIGGSKLTGGQFISGDARLLFQRDLERSLKENCRKQGIEILNVSITSIQPPQEIATPIRAREVAKQERLRYQQEKLQQLSEAQLKVQQLLADQKKQLVEAEQTVVEQTTRANQDQRVAVLLAEQKRQVAETQLEAATNQASALVAGGQASADVIRFKIKADLAGLAARVQAFDGDGSALAQNILLSKLAPAFRSILSNSEGPLMELFGQFSHPPNAGRRMPGPGVTDKRRAPADSAASSSAAPPLTSAPSSEDHP